MTLHRRELIDFDLLKFTNTVKILLFRGVFVRNELPERGPLVTYQLSLILMIGTTLKRIGWHTKRVIMKLSTLPVTLIFGHHLSLSSVLVLVVL